MAKERYKCMVRGLGSEELWKDRYCFMPLTGPCVYCGGYQYVYGAYIKANGVLGVRYVCRNCGHSDDVKRVGFVKAEVNRQTKIEVEKRRKMQSEKDGGRYTPIYSGITLSETLD